MPRRFENGKEVQLRSGGPVMTVKDFGRFPSYATRDVYVCTWFDKKGNQKKGTFTEEELEPFDAASLAG